MIVVTTGVPGAGKTLWALTWVKAKAEKEKREVFYSGIKDLKLPWTEIDPEKWMDCPPGSIVVIDECQRVFRPRNHGSSVPKHVADLETHRHLGIDLVLITQHPMLMESNVRRLCGLHFHVVRSWGRLKATVHEWPTIKENCDKSRDDSVRHEFAYPKANFGLYHSAEVHTHKARIPYHFWIICAVPFAVCYAAWRVYSNWFPGGDGVVNQSLAAATGGRAGASAAPGGGGLRLVAGSHAERINYVEQFRPRVAGLHYTAPVYDEITKPTEVPFPAACIASESRCKCWTQQATALEVPDDLCRSITAGGFFVGWKAPGGPVQNAVPINAQAAVPSFPSPPAVINIGPPLVAPAVKQTALTSEGRIQGEPRDGGE